VQTREAAAAAQRLYKAADGLHAAAADLAALRAEYVGSLFGREAEGEGFRASSATEELPQGGEMST
jgi:hypothetical protein